MKKILCLSLLFVVMVTTSYAYDKKTVTNILTDKLATEVSSSYPKGISMALSRFDGKGFLNDAEIKDSIALKISKLNKYTLVDQSVSSDSKADYYIFGNVDEQVSEKQMDAKISTIKLNYIVSDKEGTSIPFDKSVEVKIRTIKKDGMTAGIKSLIFPGMGQFYNEDPIKGILYTGTGLGLLSGTIITGLQTLTDKDNYKKASNSTDAKSTYTKAQNSLNMFQVLGYCTLGFWLYNFYDAYVDANNFKERSELISFKTDLNNAYCLNMEVKF